MITRTWEPLSREHDPVRRAVRQQTVARQLRAHRVLRAGGTPCGSCGGATDDVSVDAADRCTCTVTDETPDWRTTVTAAHERVAASWDPNRPTPIDPPEPVTPECACPDRLLDVGLHAPDCPLHNPEQP